jgi:hypothetical protein
MARLVDYQLLHYLSTEMVAVECLSEGTSTWHLDVDRLRKQPRAVGHPLAGSAMGQRPLSGQLLGIDPVRHVVLVTVEQDQWNESSRHAWQRIRPIQLPPGVGPAKPCCFEWRWKVMSSGVFHARMYTDRSM